MSSARKPSGFLKLHYDKLIMITTLVVLIACTLFLLLRLGQEGRSIRPSDLESTNPLAVTALDTTPLDALTDAFNRPYQIPPAQRRMLVGDLRVSSIPEGLPIPFDAEVCPFTGQKQPVAVNIEERDSDGDGIPDLWETKFGLNPVDPNDGQSDVDGDGFTNLEEFQAASLPNDPTSTPPPVAKLRLVRSQVNPFKLRFLGTSRMPNGDTVYQLNLRSLERTYFARMKEDVEGFKVTAYEENTAEGPTLTLQQGDRTMRLVQGRIRDEQAYTAFLVFLVDGKRFRSNIGESIPLLDKIYKVIDIREDRVVIREEDSGRDLDVGLISEEERRSLSAGG